MRIGVMTCAIVVILMGCAHLEIKKNVDGLNTIQAGDTLESILKRLGPPDFSHDISNERKVVYYQTQSSGLSGAPLTEALCTAVALENGRVVAVGEDPSARWTSEENERKRLSEEAERDRLEKERTAAAAQKAEAERREKIIALEKAVKPVPAANAALNLKLYRQLLDLDPQNARYQKKVAYYNNRMARQAKTRHVRARLSAKEKQRIAWEKSREKRNKMLRQYTGNGIAEMAVHDMGGGALYVWVKNISQQIITTHPDHFTLIDRSGQRIPCHSSETLDSVLEPGSISHGKIEYDQKRVPKTLIFENGESGRVAKSFDG
ncbi:DUF3192 domain-containing protein [Desulfosarcina ovata]|uniref:Uncharacterized protein n=2 Tax=Desulfosarcina ovata TaxID=83564 RepID=A0A5K8A4H4_9BACT|nr:DUF3192 domain-containing protein [Desulfosarcina ovata]BBO80012.1 hypothetical protein DSCO28_05780 [Desulfosarcina ovata subsp. sediminis]BBO87326.1 hypothetical protein DSCOOX_05060 [Desulfosarcina ovata subsp. ovata]